MWRAIVQFVHDLREAIIRWFADDGPLMAAATAYYVGLSFFPLLLVLTAGLGWFLQHTHSGQDAHQQVLQFVANNMSDQLAADVEQSMSMVQEKSAVNGPLGLITILITALAAFAQLDSALDRIAGNARGASKSVFASALAFVVQRGRAFLVLLGLGAVVFLVFLAGLVITAIQTHASAVFPKVDMIYDALQIAVTLTINAGIFTLLFRLLPKDPADWGNAFSGGLLTAAAWEIGRQLLAIFIARSQYASAYGVIGAFLAILLWCYYAVAIVLIGAEYIQIIRARHVAGTEAEKGRGAAI
jgi:membrane protein